MDAKANAVTSMPSRDTTASLAFALSHFHLRAAPSVGGVVATFNLSATKSLGHDCLQEFEAACPREEFQTTIGRTLAENCGQVRLREAQTRSNTGLYLVARSVAEFVERAGQVNPRSTDRRSGVNWKYVQTGECSRIGEATHPGGTKETDCHADF